MTVAGEKHANDQREGDVSPRRTAIQHALTLSAGVYAIIAVHDKRTPDTTE
jgi:hypothetical protein